MDDRYTDDPETKYDVRETSLKGCDSNCEVNW